MGANRKRSVRGVTLVELLIAMAISSLVIGLATFSFSLFSKDWKGRSSGFARAAAQAQRLELLANAMESTVPWLVRARAGRLGYYFLGRSDGLTLISSDPIFGGGAPAVVRLFREIDPEGMVQLVYEEASLREFTLKDAEQVLPFKNRLVVVRGLKSLKFRYYGWESSAARAQSDADSGRRPVWTTEFDGLQRTQHPLRISVAIDGSEAIYLMPERPGFSKE